MKKIIDNFNREVKVGDIIHYATRSGDLQTGIVLDYTSDETKWGYSIDHIRVRACYYRGGDIELSGNSAQVVPVDILLATDVPDEMVDKLKQVKWKRN